MVKRDLRSKENNGLGFRRESKQPSGGANNGRGSHCKEVEGRGKCHAEDISVQNVTIIQRGKDAAHGVFWHPGLLSLGHDRETILLSGLGGYW